MRQRLKLLIAEDSQDDAFFLHRAIEKTDAPITPRFVSDGEEVIEYLSGKNHFADREKYPMPALIILDIEMPRKSGLEVLRWLKSHDALRKMPVVMLSSSDRQEDVERAYSLGANAYMVKPLGSARLRELVRAIDTYWRDFCMLPDN
jgi:CheY-like chemotaxis protein